MVNHVVLALKSPSFVWLLDLLAPDATPASPPEIEDEDSTLLLRAASGDQGAWQDLFTRWKKPLLSFFYRSLGSVPEAEDPGHK